MEKSKLATIIMILIMLAYGLLSSLKLVWEINIIYLYIINPITWILFAVLLRFTLGKSIENKKLKNQINYYVIVASLVYIIVYMLSGLIVTFGNNPYNTTLIGLIHNLWIFGTVIIAKEYIRYMLINNVYDRDKKSIAVIISIVYVIIEFEFIKFIGVEFAPLIFIKYIIQRCIPNIAKNIVFSYTAIYGNYAPGMIYNILTNLYFWISPIIPNAPWVMTAIIDITIPVILFLYIRFTRNKLDRFRTREKILNSDPKNIIPLVILIIFAIWFAIGIFPIKPISIASGSMEKELYVGDVAIIKKCNANDVNVGDIIEYKMEGYTVVHRIVEKYQTKGDFYFKTKGDNNAQPDAKVVTEDQLIGKVIYKIRYIGYPAIWLNLLRQEQALEIET